VPPRGNASRDLYIVIFRSNRASWDEYGRHWKSEDQTDLAGTTWPGPHATWSLLGLVAPLVDFFCSRRFFMIKY
jgi:hypothetical protein